MRNRRESGRGELREPPRARVDSIAFGIVETLLKSWFLANGVRRPKAEGETDQNPPKESEGSKR